MGSEREGIGWFRGIVTGLGILVVGLAASVMGADEIITRFTSLSRDNVAYLASAFFLGCVLAAAWVLRRLQDRGVI